MTTIILVNADVVDVKTFVGTKIIALTQILNHQEADSECFSLQWEVEDTATLHRWHTEQGMSLNEEMMKVFKDKVVGFPTLMEVIK